MGLEPKLKAMSVPFSTAQFEKKPNPKTPRRKIRLDKIVATQNKLDHTKVMSIAQRGADDGTDPLVHAFGGKYYVGDGHHRIGGAIERGDTYITARVSR
jgi:hypothetical protein